MRHAVPIAIRIMAVVALAGCGPSAASLPAPTGGAGPGVASATPVATSSPATAAPSAAVVVPASPIPALQARLVDPIGLAIDGAGNLYVSDCWEPTDSYIFRIDPKGILSTFAGVGTTGFSGDGGPATSAKIHCPLGMAFGPDGAMYFADHVNNRIRRIDGSGTITTVAGSGAAGLDQGSFSGDGGPATMATLQEPYGVAFDKAGDLFISDRDNNRIRKVDTAGIITTIAGNGKTGYSGDGVLGSEASIEFPLGIITDAKGDVIFADGNNKRARMIDLHGIITTIAGTGVDAATGDGGPAKKAALADPENFAFDGAGRLYITDTVFNTLRRIDSHGVITTLASRLGGNGLVIDAAGNLYVSQLNSVFRIDPKGVVTLFAGQGA